ncbi:MAG: Cysteine desulfurase family protein [Actinomycetia bacterium]|nr:Cysteine desulfurase family protein [Actinomycetes bacterium]
MPRTYLDHASGSPLRPAAFEAMLPYLRDHPGDPGRVHTEGRTTRVAVEDAREQVAALFGSRPREIVFTASGTEAINTAVWGASAGRDGSAHAVTTAVEHSAVRDALERAPVAVTTVGVDGLGRVSADAVLDAISPQTVLVSVQWANHEVGTLQPVLEIVAACRERGVLVHVDACMAAGHVPVDFRGSVADLVSVTGYKLGAPRGTAALLVRRGLRFAPFVVGGAQERARRGGAEDVAGIVGFGAACAELAADGRLDLEASLAWAQTERLIAGTTAAVDGVQVYGDPIDRVPHLVCLGVEGVEAEPVLLGLDQHGVAVHSGSSCSSELLEPSPVLQAMGVDADHSLRVSVGWSTTDTDIDAFLTAFPDVVTKLRALRG